MVVTVRISAVRLHHGALVIAMDWCPIDSVVEEVERSSAFAGGCRVLALALPPLLLSRIRFIRPCDLCSPGLHETGWREGIEVADWRYIVAVAHDDAQCGRHQSSTSSRIAVVSM
jgi:hypothetical protein